MCCAKLKETLQARDMFINKHGYKVLKLAEETSRKNYEKYFK